MADLERHVEFEAEYVKATKDSGGAFVELELRTDDVSEAGKRELLEIAAEVLAAAAEDLGLGNLVKINK